MKLFRLSVLAAALAAATQLASASPFTSTSPTGFDVTSVGASTVGGIVVQMVGANGNIVISQISATSLFRGQPAFTPVTIGTQAGWGDAVTDALGGGLAAAHFRFSLFDGDSASGNFDFNDNRLEVFGVDVGNWSGVATQNTDGVGAVAGGGMSTGFRNNLLDTGWFSVNSAPALASMFAAINTNDSISFELRDLDNIGDNFFDFTLGIDASLINVGSGPVVQPPSGVPEPASLALVGLALAGAALSRRRKA